MVDRPLAAQRIARLDLDTYKLLEKKALGSIPVAPNDPITAGIRIGIENTLRLIREDITIGA